MNVRKQKQGCSRALGSLLAVAAELLLAFGTPALTHFEERKFILSDSLACFFSHHQKRQGIQPSSKPLRTPISSIQILNSVKEA